YRRSGLRRPARAISCCTARAHCLHTIHACPDRGVSRNSSEPRGSTGVAARRSVAAGRRSQSAQRSVALIGRLSATPWSHPLLLVLTDRSCPLTPVSPDCYATSLS